MENYAQPEPKKSNTTRNIIIAVVAVVVLICCCLVLVIGALTVMGPLVGKTFSSINNSLTNPSIPKDFPTFSPDDFPTISPDATMPTMSDTIPTGGRGDDMQRTSAWGYVILAAALDGCSLSNPKASDMNISVKQEPDSAGVWVEEWTVNCDGGSTKVYAVTFTPDANGSTDIKVK